MEALIKLGVFLALVTIGFVRGRRNDRQFAAQLVTEEAEVDSVLIFATKYPPASDCPQDPILVSGSVVLASDFFRHFIAALRKIVGGRYDYYENLLERGRRLALVRLKRAAKAAGADMVFNVRYTTAQLIDGRSGQGPAQMEVVAYGTALVSGAAAVADSAVHYQPPVIPERGNGGFDLFSNPVGKIWFLGLLLTVFMALFAMVFDRYLHHHWRFTGDVPWSILLALSGVVVTALAVLACKRGVPVTESLVLAFITTPILAGNFYFAALHINALTADLTPTPYRVGADGLLRSEQSGAPELFLGDVREYWEHQPVGTEVEILVVRGWLGFYQYDVKPLRDKYRTFYRL